MKQRVKVPEKYKEYDDGKAEISAYNAYPVMEKKGISLLSTASPVRKNAYYLRNVDEGLFCP